MEEKESTERGIPSWWVDLAVSFGGPGKKEDTISQESGAQKVKRVAEDEKAGSSRP